MNCFFFEERQDYILLHDLLKKAVNKAVQSHKGHLDLFLRFLLGISLESNQKLLKGLLTDTEDSRESIRETIQYIKLFQKKHTASETSTNLTFCLSELKDYSLLNEIQKVRKCQCFSGKTSVILNVLSIGLHDLYVRRRAG